MNIVIVGDGKVGTALTQQLSKEGHDITVIDNNAEVLTRSMELYDIMAQGEILEKKGGTILGNRAVSQELIMLGNRIRECRKERAFSQEILAEKSGVSTNTISRIEGGQMAMSVGILQKIVKALGVDANTLLGVSTEVNETEIWVSAFSSRVQELKENEQEILKHTMNALIESMEKNRLKISTDKSSQVLHTR